MEKRDKPLDDIEIKYLAALFVSHTENVWKTDRAESFKKFLELVPELSPLTKSEKQRLIIAVRELISN